MLTLLCTLQYYHIKSLATYLQTNYRSATTMTKRLYTNTSTSKSKNSVGTKERGVDSQSLFGANDLNMLQRLVGCCACVQSWISRNNRCPRCSADTDMGQFEELKELEEMLTTRVLNEDSEVQGSEQHPEYYEESTDNDFETPRPCIRLNM